jgi:Tol biopolymer transport system component
VGPAHVLVAGEDGFVGYDVTHRATFVLAAAFRLNPSVSTAGVAFGEVGSGTLVRSTLSGSTRTLASVPACGGKDADPFFDLQALPDGSGAVYAADCALPHDLFSIAPDGSGLSRLTDTPQDELGPALSPDGTRVAFSRTDTALCECDEQIWITSLDGSDPRSVPLPSDSGLHQDEHPSFSPDGTRLVFSRWDPAVTGDTARLAEASAAGGAATLLKPSGGNPAWGPSRIAFNAADVETVAPDGTDAAVVPNTSLAEGGPAAWSADGRLAVLRVSTFSIYFPAAKTSIRLPGLHDAIGPAPGLAWSPDGTRLAFTGADANGVDDVWTVRVDGTGLTRVTHDLDADGAIAWR